jgi:hypothetical protein
MVPSSGGGTKLMRTLLVEDAEGVCSGTGEGAADSSGVGEGVGAGVGASCPIAAQIEAKAIRMTALNFFVMSIGVASRAVALCERRETSLVVGPEEAEETRESPIRLRSGQALDFARNDK